MAGGNNMIVFRSHDHARASGAGASSTLCGYLLPHSAGCYNIMPDISIKYYIYYGRIRGKCVIV